MAATQPRLKHSSRLFHEQGTLLHELQFIHKYHHDPRNQALHICTTWIGLSCILLILTDLGIWPAAAFIAAFYIAYYAFLDILVATLWSALFSISALIIALWDRPDSIHQILIIAMSVVAVVAFSLQGLGHLIFEKALPAFRAFEFLVTTPFFLGYVLGWALFGTKRFRPEVYTLVVENQSDNNPSH